MHRSGTGLDDALLTSKPCKLPTLPLYTASSSHQAPNRYTIPQSQTIMSSEFCAACFRSGSKPLSIVNPLRFSIGPPPGLPPAHLAVPLMDAHLDAEFDAVVKEIDLERAWHLDLTGTGPRDHWLAEINPHSRLIAENGSPCRDFHLPPPQIPNPSAAPNARTSLQKPEASVPCESIGSAGSNSRRGYRGLESLRLRVPVVGDHKGETDFQPQPQLLSNKYVLTSDSESITDSDTVVASSSSLITTATASPCGSFQKRNLKAGFEDIHEYACRARIKWVVARQYPQRRFVNRFSNAPEPGESYNRAWHQQRNGTPRNSPQWWGSYAAPRFEGQNVMRAGDRRLALPPSVHYN